LRASTVFRVGLVLVRFFALLLALLVFASPVVFVILRVLGVFAFAAFALAIDGAALVPVVTREVGRVATCGDVSTAIVPLSADLFVSRAASPAGQGLVLVFTGCHVSGDRIALCFRSSRAASSRVSRPRCVYIPGFTLFCLLICGT
jgi:hypothetical protein